MLYPALHLPRNAGYFDRIPEKLRANQAEWTKIFRRLHTRIRPWLVQENEQGESIVDQLRENLAEIRDRLPYDQISTIEKFLGRRPDTGYLVAGTSCLG